MTDNWHVSAFFALIIYGFWGFFPKLAVAHISPQSALIYQVLGAMLVGIPLLVISGFRLETHPAGSFFAILTGIAGLLGTLCYYTAASRGKISIVVSITALYPLITILLAAVFLRETISPRQVLGMLFGLIAIVLLAVEP